MRQLKIIKQVTNRETQSLDKYLLDIGKIELISAEEEVHLARKIHEGDLNARDQLINANLRFVVSVSKQYQYQGLSLPDMINEGNLGLIKAAERFDETRGFKFISYAVWWIRQSILQALAEQARIVRLPLNRIVHINKLKRTFSVLEQKYEREPTTDEISQEIELTPIDVLKAIKNSGRDTSLDAPLSYDEGGSMYDVLLTEDDSSPDKDLLSDSLSKEIDRVLSTLPEREAEIIRLYFGLEGKPSQTLEEISEEFNITRERIRQLKEKAIKRLKHISKDRMLKSYMG
ncbi:MAG TPA: RNA polymerase sigma factor RpoD/SigA [Bacteroides sp.]|nr:RNA polymerase sigma factor RpoD/SigA [Bacteroides sp.]